VLYRQVQTVLVPAGLIGGYIFFSSRDGFLADARAGFVGPFSSHTGLASASSSRGRVVRYSLHAKTVALTGLADPVFMSMMLGGPAVLFEDPWLFSAVVAPGIELSDALAAGAEGTQDPPAEASDL